MAFTYDLTTSIGQLRLRVGDTIANAGPRPPSGSASNFSDEEMQHFLTSSGGLSKAVALVFETLSGEWSVHTNIQLGPRKEEFARIADAYARRAEMAGIRAGTGTSFSVGWDRVDGYSEADSQDTEL